MTKQGESPPVDVRAARAMARRIIEHHFGEKPKRTKHEAGGLSNFVFLVNHAECDFVVRISPDPAKINDFIKEQWAMTKAREVGVPTPEILKVGNEVVPYPYMVSQRVAGRAATFHPHREEILREMGRYAALINSVSTNGFGGTFDWSSNQLSLNATWGEFLHKELKFEKRMQTLEKQRMLSPPRLKKLRTILERVAGSRHRATLNHGDIRLKNMIVDDDGCIAAVIDWEHCTSNLSPPWELSLALHDLSID